MVWTMFGEFLARVALLDVSWLVTLVASNWVYIFMFVVLGFFLYGKKNLVLSFLFMTLMVWLTVDLTRLFGWVVLAPAFLCAHYLSRLVVLTFSEADEKLSEHFNIIAIVQFWVVYIIYNVFIG